MASTLLSSPRETTSAWKWHRSVGSLPRSCLPWENAACPFPSPPPEDQSVPELPLEHLHVQASRRRWAAFFSLPVETAACKPEPRLKVMGLGVHCQQQGKSTAFLAGATNASVLLAMTLSKGAGNGADFEEHRKKPAKLCFINNHLVVQCRVKEKGCVCLSSCGQATSKSFPCFAC